MCIAAVNAATSVASAAEQAQLARIKTVILAEINTYANTSFQLTAFGSYDAEASRVSFNLQPVKLNAAGEVMVPPNP